MATLTDCPGRIAWLLEALDRYDSSGNYDEVFWKAHRQIADHGDAGKAEICLVVCWKRAAQGHWLSDLLSMPEESVRRITRSAFAAPDDEAKLNLLVELPGLAAKGPLATALLCAHDPDEYGVMDWRARRGLDVVFAGLAPGANRTVHYLERVRELRDEVRRERAETTAREIDQALWVLGAPTPSR